jgi:hypothetical protein
VHLVCFTIEIYYDARTYERQKFTGFSHSTSIFPRAVRIPHSITSEIKYFFKTKCFTVLYNISLRANTNYHPERQWASWGIPFSSSMTVIPVTVCVATNSVSPEFRSWPNHRLSWRFRRLNPCVPKFWNTCQPRSVGSIDVSPANVLREWDTFSQRPSLPIHKSTIKVRVLKRDI